MKLLLKCTEANHTCDKNQYKEASFFELIKLNIHLIHCRACQKYSARNGKLSALMKNEKFKSMPSSDKDEMKKQLLKKMSK